MFTSCPAPISMQQNMQNDEQDVESSDGDEGNVLSPKKKPACMSRRCVAFIIFGVVVLLLGGAVVLVQLFTFSSGRSHNERCEFGENIFLKKIYCCTWSRISNI